MQVHHVPDTINRMVDMETAAANGKGYENWAKIHNLKNASIAYRIYQESGFNSPEELDAPITPPTPSLRTFARS